MYYTMKLLLTEFEVHTVRYGASSIPEAIIQQEKNRGSITCIMEQVKKAKEVSELDTIMYLRLIRHAGKNIFKFNSRIRLAKLSFHSFRTD